MDKIRSVCKKVKSGVRRFMDKTVNTCRDLLSSKENRLVVGLTLIDIGVALTASVYIKIPN